MKKLVDEVANVVPDMLNGMLRLHPALAMLEGHMVVVRADVAAVIARGEVALISGGGSGHEPAHAGYVGAGMLTAAVCGDVFTSPSADAVLAAIRAVAGPGGVLLVVKNYTGDRLNFGLAAEIARSEGIDVEMAIVDDDVALDVSNANAGRRGLAGTVLVHKLAGATAARGGSLQEVTQAARDGIAALGTMGVALSACTVPAVGTPGFTLADNEIELGLGIHGEAGVRRMAVAPASELVSTLLDRIVGQLRLVRGDRVALLVNNLGTTPMMEMGIVSGAALTGLEARGIEVCRAWSGSFLTALDMAGFSLSVLRVDRSRLDLLDAPADVPAWPANAGRLAKKQAAVAVAVAVAVAGAVAVPASATASKLRAAAANDATSKAIAAICAALHAAEPELTRLDQAVGDGDLGISLSRGARAIESALPGYPVDDLPATFRAMSSTLRNALGGTSGPLYAIGLLRAAAAIEAVIGTSVRGASRVDIVGAALKAAADGISETGGAQRGDRTMLDAIIPAFEAAESSLRDGVTEADRMELVVEAATSGAKATSLIAARRGRSSYLGDRAIGERDPGAVAVALWLEVLAKHLT